MKKLIKCLRVIPYVFEFKTNVFCGLLFWVIGVLVTVGSMNSYDSDFSSMMGPIYIVLGPMMVVQLCYSLLMSKMIGASPKRKWLEVVLASVLTGLNTLISYVFTVILATIQVVKQPGSVDIFIKLLFYVMVFTVILNIYFTVCYKQLLVSSILFFISYMVVLTMMNIEPLTALITGHFAGSWVRAIIECAILLVVGFLGSCLLRKALYKAETSSYAGGFKLRKMMQ